MHFKNADARICDGIYAGVRNASHLLECKYRHFFKSELKPEKPQFTANTKYLVEVLYALSPVWFEVRIHMEKDLTGNWWDWNSANHFDEFNEALKKDCLKSFKPVENVADLDKNVMYVLRAGKIFKRCTIWDIE